MDSPSQRLTIVSSSNNDWDPESNENNRSVLHQDHGYEGIIINNMATTSGLGLQWNNSHIGISSTTAQTATFLCINPNPIHIQTTDMNWKRIFKFICIWPIMPLVILWARLFKKDIVI